MANVLPPETKRHLDTIMRSRMVIILSLMLLLGAGVASLALTPAFIMLQFASSALDEQVSDSRQLSDQAAAARAQALTQGLLPVATATSSPSSALAHALSLRPSGISITSLSVTANKVVVQGVASRREAVQEYREALDADPRYTQVSVPVAALVGTQDGRFSITLTGTF